MAITIVVTSAGRAALVNAENTGTNAVTITQLGITAAVFVPNPALVALPGEIKRIASVAGVVVADDQIHVTCSDVTNDAYAMRGLGFYLADGTLFATYGQAGEILNKTSESMMLLALDVAFADIDAEMIAFGDTNFVLPPATTEVLGLVELATTVEGQAGSDATRVLTPLTGKQSVLGWLLSQDGSGSGLDADMLDGLHASAFSQAGHTHGTMADQNANAVAITGGAINGTTLGAVTPASGRFSSLQAEAANMPTVNITRAGVASWGVGGFAGGGNGFGICLNANPPALYLDTAGKVGIGTTNPSKKFTVSNGGANGLEIDPGEGAYTRVISYDRVGGAYTPMMLEGLEIRFLHGNGAEGLRLTATGNLGVGTTNPQAKADVAASNPVRGIVSVVRNFAGAGQNGCQIEFTQSAIANWAIGQPAGVNAFAFFAGRSTGSDGTEVFRVAGNGNLTTVGSATIGDGTGTRSVTLATSRSYLTIEADGVTNSAGATIYYSWAGGGQGPLKFNNSAGEVMRLSGTSNVGIGANDPQCRLHVKAASEIARFETTTARGGGNGFIGIGDPTGRKAYFGFGTANDDLYIINQTNRNLIFGTNDQSRLTLDTSGHFVPASDGVQILGWPTARFRQGHFSEFVRIGGFDAWHYGNDGSGSGLDADLLDGQQGAYYLPAASYTAADVLAKLVGVDGPGSGLDADRLDGYQASDFLRVVAASVGQNGYIVFANGLKIIWGRVGVNQDSYSYVTYPITFDTVPTPVFPTLDAIANNSQQNSLLAGSTTTGFTIYQSGDISGSLPYHVMGV